MLLLDNCLPTASRKGGTQNGYPQMPVEHSRDGHYSNFVVVVTELYMCIYIYIHIYDVLSKMNVYIGIMYVNQIVVVKIVDVN